MEYTFLIIERAQKRGFDNRRLSDRELQYLNSYKEERMKVFAMSEEEAAEKAFIQYQVKIPGSTLEIQRIF